MNAETPRKPGRRVWGWIALSAGAVLYLVISSIGGTQLPYVNARELPELSDRRVRVAGKVAYGGIELDGPGDVSIRFGLIDEASETVLIEYTGVRPDAFREGAQAAVEGTYDAAGRVFHASLLQAKCPSKYEVGLAEPTRK
ncbi:cytochrome c maturation protein CcmE [bacterium]|nr:cytochrome c maturation protein CcmE [bacterium]